MRLKASRNIAWSEAAAPSGITPQEVYLGPEAQGLPGIQVAVARATLPPSRQVLRNLLSARKGKRQLQVIVAVVHDGTAHVIGPDPQAQPVELPVELAARQLQSVLDEPDVLAAIARWTGFRKGSDSTGIAGFTNSGLFATHHLTSNVPKRADWASLGGQAAPLLGLRRKQLIEALGFTTQPGPSSTLLLSGGGRPPRVVAILLDDSEHFDAKAPRFQLSPVAHGLAVAAQIEAPWLVVLRKDQIRLYPGRDGIGVGSKGQAETYFEVDLSTIDVEFAALLPLVFSASALAVEGTADELLRDSSRYATDLGVRLRERIYGDEVIPALAVEVAERLAAHAGITLDADGLAASYRVTLHILFRLLFQAYAEDRGLLPAGRNEGFDANSLKTNARRLIDTEPQQFGDAATIWLDLVQVWNAIDHGNPQWQIPSYNGGLFSTDPARSREGALIKQIELPDSVLGPALKNLLIDTGDDGVHGPVDFRSLSVREFGTIYEGLLESSLSLAEQDLTVDSSGAWVPAKTGDTVDAYAGRPYFHSASGERKATGSYFTPKVVVDHLIERTVVPVLNAHLAKIERHLTAGDAVVAGREFFDFRVADLAMGSGHFLVAAVDKIEALMRDFLTRHNVPAVTEELLRLVEIARAALDSDEVAKSEVEEIGLLRRQIARRCIYGLDVNPMAVELARLALWIHTFVPGLPMSNLDHGLVCANSLTGIGTIDEAIDALQPSRAVGAMTLFDQIINDQLASAKTLLIDVASASEANKAEVEEGARLLAQAKAAADTARRIFDAAVAARLGRIVPGLIMDDDSLRQVLAQPEIEDIEDELRPAHMPFLFPEVFLRDAPGFDVLLGNPPWEKVKIETDGWWGIRLPGLRSMPQKQKNRALADFRASRPDLEANFEAEQAAVLAVNKVIKSGPFDLGSGDTDLYQAFAWRNWQLLRTGGRAGVVLPRGALSGSALANWRRSILGGGAFADVCFIENAGRWAFDMEPRYTISLTVIERGGASIVRWCGPFASAAAFRAGAHALADIDANEFTSWSDTAAFPLIPDAVSTEVFRQMKKSPRFNEARDDWEFRPVTELHATGDKSLLEFDTDASHGRVPIYTGACFALWDPDAGVPYAYANTKLLRTHLANKLATQVRGSRSAYNGMTFAEGQLPMDSARIAFRDIARATDTRTMICALLPPGSSAVHKAPLFVRRAGGAAAEACLLGIVSSIPFDWFTRRWVELTMSYEIVNACPVPRPDLFGPRGRRIATIAGRLAAIDERYSDWAAEVGVPVGSVTTPIEKDDLIAELDALVSLLYGLSEDQVEHIFATFHRGWDESKPDFVARLAAVLKHYRTWKVNA